MGVEVLDSAEHLAEVCRKELEYQAIPYSDAAFISYHDANRRGIYGLWWDTDGKPHNWIPLSRLTHQAERQLARSTDSDEDTVAAVLRIRANVENVGFSLYEGMDADLWCNPDGRWNRVAAHARPAF